MQFVPSNLCIEKGSTVTWRVVPDTTHSTFAKSSSRSHIISFDDIFVESPKLELSVPSSKSNNTECFSMNF